MTRCKECNGSGLTDNHVTGEIECMACEGAGDDSEAMKLFSVCPSCEFDPKTYDGNRAWGDFDNCATCKCVMDVWTESGVRNEQQRIGLSTLRPRHDGDATTGGA